MKDSRKTKKQLIEELESLRSELSSLRQTEQKLRDTNELLGEAIASSQGVIYRYDAKADQVEYYGDGLNVVEAQAPQEANGRSLEETLKHVHPEDFPAVRHAIDEAAAAGTSQRIPLEIEYRRNNGDDEYCWIRNRAVLVTDENGEMDRIVGSITDITDKHRTAEEIRQQRDFAESLLQTAQALVVVLDTQGRVIRLNKRAATVMGMSAEELSGCDWSEVCIADGGQPLREHLQEALTSDATCEFIARLYTSNDEERIVEWFCAPLRGEEGGTSGLLLMGRDITESQEHELVRAALVEAIPDMIFRYTADGVATDYRPGTGVDPYVPPEEFLGRTLGDVLPTDVAELIHNAIRRSLATGELVTVEYTLDMPDGEHIYEGRVFPSGENEVLNIVRDISESRRTARRLRASEKNLRAFIEAMPDVAMVLDTDGRYVAVYANDTLLYRPPEELSGQRMHDVLPKDVADGAMAAINETLRTRESQVFEYELDVPAGHRWFEGRTAPFLVGESEGDRVIWMARDVTDRHEAKQELQRAYEELEARVAERTTELRRSEQEERLFSEQLRRLQEVNAILGQIEDVGELCRRTIELARERLGFGRMSIWFLDEDKAHTLGCFGTDEHGQVVDERGTRLRIVNEYNRDQAVLSGAIPLGVWENIPLRNAQTEIVGHGTMASAGMWDGTDVIGKITADDLLEGSSLPPRQLEILRLLGVTVGHLCTRTRAEEALQASEERYRQLVESTADMVWSCDLDGKITFVNGAAEAMLGLKPVDCIGRSSFEVMHADDRKEAEDRFQWCVERGDGWSGVLLRFLHDTGGTRYVESMARPVFDGDGELTGFTGIDRDITQRREAEEALRKAHLELISARENERRVLAKELHDSVAQDLVVLQLMVSGLRNGGKGQNVSTQQISEKLGEAITEIRRICHGLYPPMLESLGLSHALVYLSELYCSAERNVSCECDEAVVTERFSPEVEITLYRIAQEATSNAIRHGKAKNVILRLHATHDLVHLEVEDDGQGFEPGGGNKLGLGLQSMKDRATSVDGSLAIESQAGRTVVSASVPAEGATEEV